MKPIPPEIRKALAFTLEEYELAAAERWDPDDELATLEWDIKTSREAGYKPSEDEQHILTLSRGMRDLLAAGHINAAVCVAIKYGEVLYGEVLYDDMIQNSQWGAWMERGQREAEAAKKAALHRWGSPEERRKIDEEILAIASKGVTARNGKQAVHEVARIMNERHPGQRITARKVRRVLTGH
jgi:hypothetical protein